MLKYSKHIFHLSFLVAIFGSLMIGFSSCGKPESKLGKVQIGACIDVAEEGVTTRSSTAHKEGVGEIVGGGYYLHGEVVTIQANVLPESDYKLVTLYEKDGKAGFTKERGMVNETSINRGVKKVKGTLCSITFTVSEDMTFIALFSDGKGESEDIIIEIGGVNVADVVIAPDTVVTNTIELSNL